MSDALPVTTDLPATSEAAPPAPPSTTIKAPTDDEVAFVAKAVRYDLDWATEPPDHATEVERANAIVQARRYIIASRAIAVMEGGSLTPVVEVEHPAPPPPPPPPAPPVDTGPVSPAPTDQPAPMPEPVVDPAPAPQAAPAVPPVQSDTTIPAGSTLDAPATLPTDSPPHIGATVLPVGTVFPVDMTLIDGSTVAANEPSPPGATVAHGTKLPAGTILPDNEELPSPIQVPAGTPVAASTPGA